MQSTGQVMKIRPGHAGFAAAAGQLAAVPGNLGNVGEMCANALSDVDAVV
jgi:hypothetical protein